MTDTPKAKKKNPAVRKPKRTGRKQLAKPKSSPPTTLLTPSSSPPLPSRIPSEPHIDHPVHPPRYSLLFPPEQISLPIRSRQFSHPPSPSHTAPPSLRTVPSQPATSNAFHTVSSNAVVSRPAINPEHHFNDTFIHLPQPSPEVVAQEVLRDLISTKFDSVITSIDGEQFGGDEQELVIPDDQQSGIRGGWGFGNRQVSRGTNRAISTAVGTNYFAKANLYANSRLPPNLPPLQL